MQDLWRLSATDLAALIKSKKVSAKEAATAALARLDAVNPKINAVVDHKPAEVLAEAAALPPEVAPPVDLWPHIERRIHVSGGGAWIRHLAAAACVALAVAGALT